jgi:transposase
MPAVDNCPDCGGTLKKLGEDVSEVLEYIPASFVVIRHVLRLAKMPSGAENASDLRARRSS